METKKDSIRFDLLPEEEIICSTGMHWKNFIRPGLIIAISFTLLVLRSIHPERNLINIIIGSTVFDKQNHDTLAAIESIILSVVILIGIWKYLKILFVRYYITSKRIISTKGFITIKMVDMLISKCEVVELKQNVNERIFNCGDIICRSAAHDVILDDVPNADRYRNVILNEMQPQNR